MASYPILKIAEIIHGEILSNPNQNALIKYLTTDSRTLAFGKGTAFFALVTSRNDGHNYLKEVAGKGVELLIVSKKPDNPEILRKTAVILVSNTLVALQQLATSKKRAFNSPVIGITGSNGKTIVKEWLFNLLGDEFSIIRSPRSFNSQIGVPLSVWLLNRSYKLAILEAGISRPGEMEKLEKIISPEIGILTNIGSAHQENFLSLEQKAQEKLMLFRNSEKLIFCADHENLSSTANDFCERQQIEKINWSRKNNPAKIQFLVDLKTTTKIKARSEGNEYIFTIPFTDESSVENACHCFAAALAVNAPMDKILKNFNTLPSIAMRLEIKKGINNCVLINDYYNSDINALSIALSSLENQAMKGHLQKILILSDIKQSGKTPHELYSEVKELAIKVGVGKIIGIGNDLNSVSQLFRKGDEFYITVEEFLRKSEYRNWKNAAILIKGAREFEFERISEELQEKNHQTVLEIDLNALIENLNFFKARLKPETGLMAMVKAFSYGSGTAEIAKVLQFHGIDYLAVAVADEGMELRKAGISTPIVVMNPESHSFQKMIDFNLEPNIYSIRLLKEFIKSARFNAIRTYPIHLKIDTGMNRLGFKSEKEIKDVIQILINSKELKICSVFSHLAASDEPNYDSFTTEQVRKFEKLSAPILKEFDYKILRHILNSAGIERFSNYQFDMARLGIGLYGVSAAGSGLKNISTLKTTVSQVKEVSPVESIGYGRKGKVDEPTKIAILPIGYADGLTRSLGNKNGRIWINGNYAPLIGNICMDICMADVTGIDVSAGDEVELFGPHIPVTELAEKTRTIPYEILTGISQRVKRIYLQE